MIKERIKRLQQLMTRIAPVPKEWIEAEQGSSGSDRIEPIRCRGWDELEGEWRTALRWRQGLSDVFSTMLSVAASTSQTGNQLCLMVIGDAGCLHADTIIYDPVDETSATVKERFTAGVGFNVWTRMKDGSIGVASAMSPIKYDPAPMYLVKFRSGLEMKVTAGHRFWNGEAYVSLNGLLEAGSCRLPTILEPDLSARTQDALRSMRTIQDCRFDCFACSCLCDEQPLDGSKDAQDVVLSPSDVLERIRRCLNLDDRASICKHSHPCQCFAHRSKQDFLTPALTLHEFSESRHSIADTSPPFLTCKSSCERIRPMIVLASKGSAPSIASLHSIGGDEGRRVHTPSNSKTRNCDSLRPSLQRLESSSHLDSGSVSIEQFQHRELSASLEPPIMIIETPDIIMNFDEISSVDFVGEQEYYDFHVPLTRNYWACGLFHHNSGKSELCDAMLVSRNCYQLEHTTGFHSGFKGEDGKDCSLLSRINHKTLITSEGDVLMSSPYFMELMSQMRRIFDGTSTASYKNSDEDKQWNGLRTPWIIGGTPALMDNDQSRLGDRFLRIHLDQPAIDERRAIVMAAMRAEREAVRETSNGQAGGKESRVRRAYALTGGYIDWLRENVADRVSGVDVSEAAEWHLHDLAEFVADMRARPNADLRKQDTHDTKEMPTRIGRQLTRLALCSAVVLGRPSVDGEVLRRAKRVALDSSKGRSMDAARWFMCINKRTGRTYQQSDGIMLSELSRWQGVPEERMQHYMSFLSKIGIMEHRSAQHSHGHWKLTPRMEQLWINVCS